MPRPPLRLVVGGVVAAGAAAYAAAGHREQVALAFDGLARSSRAGYTIAAVAMDYRYSLRGVPTDSVEYKNKLSKIHLRSAKRLLKLCETNGGFYVKAGQFVSSLRQVPREFSSTLSVLQDQATPYNFNDIRRLIEQELGTKISDVFLVFDEQPIAAASIAQVHRGILKDKQDVAIKVQYPRLEERMKIDIMTMAVLSKLMSQIFPEYRFERILSEFKRAMSLELDFVQEANNSEQTAKYFRKNKALKIPRVFRNLTTSRVMTMQFCGGHKVDDFEFMKNEGINPAKVAEALMKVFGEMIYIHGFVHGDPHPGNILVSPEGQGKFSLVLLDHGNYIELDESFRLHYCQLWMALISLDRRKILELGERLGVGQFVKYFPVIFTGRTLYSKSVLGMAMSGEERSRLRQEMQTIKPDDISSFMESLPQELFVILRIDGLLRSIVGKLGTPRLVRLHVYAKCALYGLQGQSNGATKHVISWAIAYVSYVRLRLVLELQAVISGMNKLGHSLLNELKGLVHWVTGVLNFIDLNMQCRGGLSGAFNLKEYMKLCG